MTVQPLQDVNQDLPAPQGHAIGFADSQADCDAITGGLNLAGFPDDKITVLNGEDGIHLLQRMMSSSLWGEAVETLMKDGTLELNKGHFALIIDTEDRNAAVRAATIAARHGGRNFNHFGLLVDERLTR